MVKRDRLVFIYIEGGAVGEQADGDFRRAWRKFLHSIHQVSIAHGFKGLRVVRGKGRSRTFGMFETHYRQNPDHLCALVVDAETAVGETDKVWAVVAQRPGDQWRKPQWAKAKHLYLMVHMVEAWLLADHDALAKVFGQGFDPSKLLRTQLEARTKEDISKALAKATKNSRKGAYQHGHAHEVLEHVDPEKVKSLYHGKRLFEGLTELISGKKPTSA